MSACDQFMGLEYNLAWSLKLEGNILLVEVGGGSGKGFFASLSKKHKGEADLSVTAKCWYVGMWRLELLNLPAATKGARRQPWVPDVLLGSQCCAVSDRCPSRPCLLLSQLFESLSHQPANWSVQLLCHIDLVKMNSASVLNISILSGHVK